MIVKIYDRCKNLDFVRIFPYTNFEYKGYTKIHATQLPATSYPIYFYLE